jgi:hypothetical protein
MAKRKMVKGMIRSGGNVPVVASIIVLVAFIAGLLLGSLVLARSVSGKNILISPMTGSFADGYNAAKKKLNDSGYFPHQNGTLSGQITGVNSNEVAFTAPLVNPLDDASLKTRTAVVTNDTTITLYRLKSADQLAADQQNGQKQMTDLQSQISSLQSQMNKCGPAAIGFTANSADCQTISKEYSDALQQMNQANQLMDMYVKVNNASLNDIKSGMQITVYGEKVQQPSNSQPAALAPLMNSFADISEQAKFNVSLIEVREMPAAPGNIVPTSANPPAATPGNSAPAIPPATASTSAK